VGIVKEYLLDTCTFIWLAADPRKLSRGAIVLLNDPAVLRRISIASVWEIVLKYRSGKLPLPRPPREWVEQQSRIQNIGILSFEREVLYRSGELPAVHDDPFDRLIAAESLFRRQPVISPDAPFLAYGCETHW
jgi:PIN domain nuclease of toxin-antitoxin system